MNSSKSQRPSRASWFKIGYVCLILAFLIGLAAFLINQNKQNNPQEFQSHKVQPGVYTHLYMTWMSPTIAFYGDNEDSAQDKLYYGYADPEGYFLFRNKNPKVKEAIDSVIKPDGSFDQPVSMVGTFSQIDDASKEIAVKSWSKLNGIQANDVDPTIQQVNYQFIQGSLPTTSNPLMLLSYLLSGLGLILMVLGWRDFHGHPAKNQKIAAKTTKKVSPRKKAMPATAPANPNIGPQNKYPVLSKDKFRADLQPEDSLASQPLAKIFNEGERPVDTPVTYRAKAPKTPEIKTPVTQTNTPLRLSHIGLILAYPYLYPDHNPTSKTHHQAFNPIDLSQTKWIYLDQATTPSGQPELQIVLHHADGQVDRMALTGNQEDLMQELKTLFHSVKKTYPQVLIGYTPTHIAQMQKKN